MDPNVTKQQIGIGNLMACGAREFSFDSSSLMFRVGSRRGVTAKMIVTLDPTDTYSVTYVEIRKFKVTKKETISDIYCDHLGEVVRSMGDR